MNETAVPLREKVLADRPFKELGIKTWGDALRTCRTRRGIRRGDLAQRCGVSEREIAEWEEDKAFPVGSRVVRLYASLHEMKKYASQLRELQDDGDAPVPAATPFHTMLGELRKGLGWTQTMCANRVQTAQTNWSRWERGEPVPKHWFLKLLDVFPELGEAAPPRFMEEHRVENRASKPIITPPPPVAEVVAPQPEPPPPPVEAAPAPTPNSEPEAPPAPSAIPPALASDAESLGVEYVRAIAAIKSYQIAAQTAKAEAELAMARYTEAELLMKTQQEYARELNRKILENAGVDLEGPTP